MQRFSTVAHSFIVQMVSLISRTQWKKGEHLSWNFLSSYSPFVFCPQCLKAPRYLTSLCNIDWQCQTDSTCGYCLLIFGGVVIWGELGSGKLLANCGIDGLWIAGLIWLVKCLSCVSRWEVWGLHAGPHSKWRTCHHRTDVTYRSHRPQTGTRLVWIVVWWKQIFIQDPHISALLELSVVSLSYFSGWDSLSLGMMSDATKCSKKKLDEGP